MIEAALYIWLSSSLRLLRGLDQHCTSYMRRRNRQQVGSRRKYKTHDEMLEEVAKVIPALTLWVAFSRLVAVRPDERVVGWMGSEMVNAL